MTLAAAAAENNSSGGAGSAVRAPKPVEVTSIPPTPVNGGATPVGGTPRPELPLEDPEQKEQTPEAPVILGPHDPSIPKEVAPEPVSDIGGPNGKAVMAGALSGGEKRKSAEEPTATNGGAKDEDRPEKKTKFMDKIADKVQDIKEKVEDMTTSGGSKGKPGRPPGRKNSKSKAVPAAVGKTERKTRSQGPI